MKQIESKQTRFGKLGFWAARFRFDRCCPYLLAFALLVLLWLPFPAFAAQPDRIPLSLELLQQRLKAPVKNEGVLTIDLRRLVIDLRSEAFRDQFYREVKAQLQRPGLPVGLDLSYSLIQGDFSGNHLGLRTPLYGEALSPIFTPTEQAQLNRDRRRLFQLNRLSRSLLSNELAIKDLQLMVFRGPLNLAQTRFLGRVDLSNTFFLGTVEAQGVDFTQAIDSSQTRFSQPVSFTGSLFEQGADFRNSIFFSKVSFSQTNFSQVANFQASEFQGTANFSRVVFQKNANFNRAQWQSNVDFAQSQWQNQAIFIRNQFNQALFLTEASFENIATFRESQFNRPVNLRGVTVLDQLDFSDTQFAKTASLNIPELKFDPKTARILGDPGQISRVLSVPSLRGNEILLRNLVRNFRQLEQIGDANQVEYLAQKLRLQDIRQQLLSTNINRAPLPQLTQIGFTAEQATAIAKVRTEQPFRSLTDLMSRNIIDLATYIKVRNRITASDQSSLWGEGLQIVQGLGINLLLVLTRFGSSFWLIFGIGLAIVLDCRSLAQTSTHASFARSGRNRLDSQQFWLAVPGGVDYDLSGF
jgi:Pentapeptide repeats (9 copies)